MSFSVSPVASLNNVAASRRPASLSSADLPGRSDAALLHGWASCGHRGRSVIALHRPQNRMSSHGPPLGRRYLSPCNSQGVVAPGNSPYSADRHGAPRLTALIASENPVPLGLGPHWSSCYGHFNGFLCRGVPGVGGRRLCAHAVVTVIVIARLSGGDASVHRGELQKRGA